MIKQTAQGDTAIYLYEESVKLLYSMIVPFVIA